MRLKLLLVAIVLAILALSLWQSLRPSEVRIDASDSSAASSPETRIQELEAAAAANPALAEGTTTAEARTRVAAEPAAGGTTEALAPAVEDVVVIDVLAIDAVGTPLRDVGVALHFDWVPTGLPPSRQDGEPNSNAAPWNVIGHGSYMSIRGLRFGPNGGSVNTGDDGRVQFQIEGASKVTSPGRLLLVNEKLIGYETLELPLVSKKLTVTLKAFARVEVTLLDASGRPVEGGYVDMKRVTAPARDVSGVPMQDSLDTAFKKTDERGLAVFDRLKEGEFEFSSFDKRSGAALRETLRIELSGRYQVQLRSTPLRLPVCAAGTVSDESGNPLPKVQVRLRVDGGPQVSVYSDEQGRFVQYSPTGLNVEVTLGGGMWDDEYEPSSLNVPFGTDDLRIHRKRAIEVISVQLDCLDGTTGEPIQNRTLQIVRYRAGRPQERNESSTAVKGRTSLLFRDHADWRVIVKVIGYEPREVALAEELQRGADENRLVLRLQRAADFDKFQVPAH